jgi:hypothetical protein
LKGKRVVSFHHKHIHQQHQHNHNECNESYNFGYGSGNHDFFSIDTRVFSSWVLVFPVDKDTVGFSCSRVFIDGSTIFNSSQTGRSVFDQRPGFNIDEFQAI